jgi:ABC-type phosphate/phosphonate transport system permease subunit
MLKYSDASVQIIAIAIVVATLDSASSRIRQVID